MTTAILALQGAFAEHERMLDKLGADWFEIRQEKDLRKPFDGLILPGGESTAMKKLLHELKLFAPLQKKLRQGLPVFGTCAGLLLLANTVQGGTPCFGVMDITAKRNAYGRQLGSFYTEGDFCGCGKIPMPFIRAPYIVSVGTDAEILAQTDGHITAARQGRQLVTAFHPELSCCDYVHRYFLNMMQEARDEAEYAV